MQKQKLLFEQGRLANRSTAEMLLLYISASKVNKSAATGTIHTNLCRLTGFVEFSDHSEF